MNVIHCSSCQQPLQIPDNLAGKKVRCPKCQQVIDVPFPAQNPQVPVQPAPLQSAPPQPAPNSAPAQPAAQQTTPDLFASAPTGNAHGQMPGYQNPAMAYSGQAAHSQPSNKANPYAKVNTGINLILIFVIVSFAGMLVGMLMSFLSSGDDIFATVGKLNRLSGLVASGFGLAGLIYCLHVPEKTKARPLVIAALICVGAKAVIGELLLTLPGILGLSLFGSLYLLMIASLLVFGLSFATAILFLLFLQKLAEFTKQQDAVEEIDFLFKMIFFLMVGGFAGMFAANFIPYGGFVFLVAMLAAEVYWVIRLIKLLQNLEFRKGVRNSG